MWYTVQLFYLLILSIFVFININLKFESRFKIYSAHVKKEQPRWQTETRMTHARLNYTLLSQIMQYILYVYTIVNKYWPSVYKRSVV